MPITKRNGKYYWGSKGPFDSRKKAAEVAQAAHASGYEGSVEIEKIIPALAALGGAAAGAVGAAASAAGPIAGAIGRTAMRSLAGGKLGGGGGGEDESGGLDEQDSHAQTEWENIHRSKSIQKLMSFVQIQKLGYAEDDRRKRPVRNPRYGGLDTRHELGSQSAGLPGKGTKEWDKLQALWEKTTESKASDLPEWALSSLSLRHFPLEYAHQYLSNIQAGEETTLEDTILQHLTGHQAIADVHNMMQFGEDWQTHPDRLAYMTPDNYEDIGRTKFVGEDGWTNLGPSIQRPSERFMDRVRKQGGQWYARVPLGIFQQEVIPAVVEPWKGKHGMGISNQAKGMMDDLHRRIRMESPKYNPNELRFPRLQEPRGAFDEDFGPERRTYHTETTPLPGQGEESDAVRPWGVTEVEDYDRGPTRPFEDFPYTETGEGGVVPRGINQGEMPRKVFDELYGNPPKYTYDAGSGAVDDDILPDEQRTDYPSAEERLAAHGGGEENPLEGTVPPPIPGDPPDSPVINPADPRNAFERNRPDLFPPRDKEKSVAKLQKFLRKEGAVGGEGGGFDGLSDTVFTSTNAGIFTPTYGGKRTKKKHHKNHKRQDSKRRKLMGKEKKSGVERLVQYLYDGSPHIAKAGKMGLAPGLDDDMTGNAPTAHAGRNRVHSPFRPLENSSDLNHKKTSREIEDAIEVAKENEPHISMGQPGGFETGITATIPPQHSSVNAVGNAKVQPGPDWGRHKSYVQKAVNGVSTMISPTENKSADGPHPQQAFIERGTENPNEAPAKDAVLKENDMQRRVKKYDDKASRRDGGQEQPAAAMAAAGEGGYPSGATMQMSSFGMNTYEQDSLARGGEEDTGHDEEEIDEKKEEDNPRLDEEGNVWIPMNPDRTKSLESMRKALEDAGDEAPLLTALYKLDYS